MVYKVIQIYEVYLSSRVVEVTDDMTEEDAYYKAESEGVEISTYSSFNLDFDGECNSGIRAPEYRDATEKEIIEAKLLAEGKQTAESLARKLVSIGLDGDLSEDDNQGQIVIYTGLMHGENGELVDFDPDEE